MSLDHISLPVPHALLESEIKFLNSALEPLGIRELFRVFPEVVALGTDNTNAFLWVVGIDENRKPIPEGKGNSLHMAFKAKDRSQVQSFHAAALKSGGRDNGAPGIRKDYHEGYYGAYIWSPAGNNIEAVVHEFAAAGSVGGEKKE